MTKVLISPRAEALLERKDPKNLTCPPCPQNEISRANYKE